MATELFLEDSTNGWADPQDAYVEDFALTVTHDAGFGDAWTNVWLAAGSPHGSIADLLIGFPDMVPLGSALGDPAMAEDNLRQDAQALWDSHDVAGGSHGPKVTPRAVLLHGVMRDDDDGEEFFEPTGSAGHRYQCWALPGSPAEEAPVELGRPHLVMGEMHIHLERSRRLKVREWRLGAIHQVPVPSVDETMVAEYPGLAAAGSFVRAVLCCSLVRLVDWPEDWSVSKRDQARRALSWAHSPLRGPGNRFPPPGAVDLQQVRSWLEPHLAASGKDAASSELPQLPTPRLVKTAQQAEEYAAEVMRTLGYADAHPTASGADGGVDVDSAGAVAQVKMEGVKTGRPMVQALFGIASLEGKAAVFFSLAGYTREALAWADRAEVACFEFAFDGTVRPVNGRAEQALSSF